jgi:hypothetical protein
LQPEEIAFPNKESLYRKTGKVRIVQLRWWKVAAAAIVLFAISITVFLVVNNIRSAGINGVSKNTNKSENTTVQNPVATNMQTDKEKISQTADAAKNLVKKNQHVDNSNISKSLKNNLATEKKLPDNSPNKKEQQEIANNSTDKPSNNLPQPLNNPYLNNNEKAKTDIAVNNLTTESNTSLTNKKLVTNDALKSYLSKEIASGNKTDNPDAKFASSNENDNVSLEEGQNKKSRGLFRKAVRFVEKTTKINLNRGTGSKAELIILKKRHEKNYNVKCIDMRWNYNDSPAGHDRKA